MHNWYFRCPVCKRKEAKRDGFALCARRGSWTSPKTLKYLCRDCFLGFCEALQIPEEAVAEVLGTRAAEGGGPYGDAV